MVMEKISPTTAGVSVVHTAFSIIKGFLMKEDRGFLKKYFPPVINHFCPLLLLPPQQTIIYESYMS